MIANKQKRSKSNDGHFSQVHNTQLVSDKLATAVLGANYATPRKAKKEAKPHGRATRPMEVVLEARRLWAIGYTVISIHFTLARHGWTVPIGTIRLWVTEYSCMKGYPKVKSDDPPYLPIKEST